MEREPSAFVLFRVPANRAFGYKFQIFFRAAYWFRSDKVAGFWVRAGKPVGPYMPGAENSDFGASRRSALKTEFLPFYQPV